MPISTQFIAVHVCQYIFEDEMFEMNFFVVALKKIFDVVYNDIIRSSNIVDVEPHDFTDNGEIFEFIKLQDVIINIEWESVHNMFSKSKIYCCTYQFYHWKRTRYLGTTVGCEEGFTAPRLDGTEVTCTGVDNVP
jgi:hypothetical protein